MKLKVVILCAMLAAVTAGCKGKRGGGGGGGWLVGTEGLMANVTEGNKLGEGYDIGHDQQLNAIACRYVEEAWVVGNAGTLLFTSDAGETWEALDLGTTADLRSLATQDAGSVFVVGAGVFLTAVPDLAGAAEWRQLGDGVTSFRAVSAAQRGDTVLALADDGGVWSYANQTLTKVSTLPGMRSIAVSPDGRNAIAAGAGLYRSTDAGRTWSPIAADASLAFEDIRIEETGEALAVGAGGVVSRIDVEGRVLTQRIGTADLKTVHITPSLGYTGLGYAAGVGGQVWITKDSGWTWTMGPNVGRTVLGADEIGFGHN